MSKPKDPPDYPGDEAIQKKLGELLHALRVKKGFSLEEVDAFVTQRTEEDSHAFLPRALGVVTKQLREDRQMSRPQLSAASGLPLGFLNKIERGKARGITVTQIVRLAMAFHHSVVDFVEQIEDQERHLKNQ